MKKTALLWVVLTFCFTPLIASAGPVRLGASIGVSDMTGDDFEGVDPGLLIGGEVLFGLAPGSYLGVLFDYSAYSVDYIDEKLNEIDLSAVYRYYFPGESARAFLSALVGYSRQSFTIVETASWNGLAVGANVGVAIPAGTQVTVDLAATGTYNTYGDASVDGTSFDGTDTSGFRWALRAGIGIPLGQAPPAGAQ